MKEYQAKQVVTLGAGRVRMDADQAKTRAHNVSPEGEGVFVIVNAIQFKRGERFGWDGDVPKALQDAFGEIAPARAAVEHVGTITKKASRRVFG